MKNSISSIISGSNYSCKDFGHKPTPQKDLEKAIEQSVMDKIKKEKYYQEVKKLIDIIETTGTLYRSSGHCIGVSDLLVKLLRERGIESKIVECNLTVIHRSGDKAGSVNFVGYKDGTDVDPRTDVPTHVVCITETDVPILIDLSISYITPKVKYIFVPITEDLIETEKNIATIDLGHTLWIYNERKQNTLVDLHEKSIIDRINTDVKIENKLKIINRFLIAIAVITTINSTRGFYDFYQKYILRDNVFGPTIKEERLLEKNNKN